jgi:membrane associated rhomboid family serine protease
MLTYIIIGITILISIIVFNNAEMKMKMTFSPYRVAHNNEWYRSITNMFIHADWMHLLFNMYVLYNFGSYVNDQLVLKFQEVGNLYFILVYVGGGLFASLPSMFKHKDNVAYHALGASGAVFSILFAFVLMNPFQKLELMFIPIGIPAFIFGPLILLAEYLMSKRRDTGVAHDAHIGGAIFGIVFLCILRYEFAVDFYESVKNGIIGLFG